jgi:septal ring factor EnvC (AmiA/AmiB activator)
MLSETPPPNPPDVSSQPSTQVSSQLPTQEFSYEEREREYRKLLEKPQPQNVPNFQEEFSTSSISNSDLQQLEQQRTQDVSINSATNPVGAELLELRSQMDTQNKQCQELEKLQKQQKQIQIEMQSEIQQLHNQLETCMDIIKSYQSNTVLSDHLPKLSELQIAEPKTDSDIQNALEEIIVSVESS